MSPAKAEYNRRYMRTRRYVSKLAGRCPCGAGLQEDDGNYCVDCASRPRTWTAKDNARKAAERLARINRGECAYCNAPATCGTLCKGHRVKQRIAPKGSPALEVGALVLVWIPNWSMSQDATVWNPGCSSEIGCMKYAVEVIS